MGLEKKSKTAFNQDFNSQQIKATVLASLLLSWSILTAILSIPSFYNLGPSFLPGWQAVSKCKPSGQTASSLVDLFHPTPSCSLRSGYSTHVSCKFNKLSPAHNHIDTIMSSFAYHCSLLDLHFHTGEAYSVSSDLQCLRIHSAYITHTVFRTESTPFVEPRVLSRHRFPDNSNLKCSKCCGRMEPMVSSTDHAL